MEEEKEKSLEPIKGEQKSLKPIKVGEWVWTVLVTCIPIVGIIMLFVWAFDSDKNPIKANWAKANLILMAICIVVWMMFGAALLGGLYSAASAF